MKHGYFSFSFSDTLQVWRILVALFACQIVGGLIGIAYAYHYFWFINAWIGGVLATLPGLAIGIVWHRRKTEDRQESDRLILVLCFLGLAVAIMGFGTGFPRLQTEMENLAGISKLPQEAIRQVEIFTRNGRTKIQTVSDPSIVAAFTQSIADATGYPVNHMQVTHSWYVVASGSINHEFELFLDAGSQKRVFGYFVVKSGNMTRYHGSFQSYLLRPWVEEHLM